MNIDRIDHLVLTVRDIQATCNFYSNVLGMEVITFGNGRTALKFGNQKLNLHQLNQEFEPKAFKPIPGSADLCLITSEPLFKFINHLHTCQVEIIEGSVRRTGAMGKIISLYIRDPDQNLLEISNYEDRINNR